MTQSVPLVSALPGKPAAPRQRVSVLWVFLGLFILGAVTVSVLEDWNIAVKALGGALAVAYLIQSVRSPGRVSTEMILYFAWMTWSLTGVFGARVLPVFWDRFGSVFQIWVLLVVVAGMTDNRRVLTLNFIMFLVGAVIVGGYSVATGEYRLAESGRARVASLAMNANAFAWIMLLSTVALAYLWMVPTRLSSLKYLILALGMVSAGIAAILSGSRTQLIGIAFFYVCWMWFCYRRLLLRSPATAVVAMAALAGMAFLFVTYLERSGTMERFTNLAQALEGRVTSGSAFTRIHLYRQGWDIFLQYPFTGIGLGNFRWTSPRLLVAHSEYVEVLCDTGLPGFVLYFAVLLVLWRRTGKVLRYSQDESARRIASLTRALIATVVLTDLGQWNYYDKAYWIVFGSLIGYTNAVWSGLRTRTGLPPPEPPRPQPLLQTLSREPRVPRQQEIG